MPVVLHSRESWASVVPVGDWERFVQWPSRLFFIAVFPNTNKLERKRKLLYRSLTSFHFVSLWDILPYLEQVSLSQA